MSYDVFEWGKPLQKAERETPKPNCTEVLLRLKCCEVCQSEVHIRDGYFELAGGKRLHMTERGTSLPVTLGHEPYGAVIAARTRIWHDQRRSSFETKNSISISGIFAMTQNKMFTSVQ